MARSAYGRCVEAEKNLKEAPAFLKAPSGYLQLNPWLKVANKNLELIQKFMGEIGHSPSSSRSRVSAIPSLRPKPWEFGRTTKIQRTSSWRESVLSGYSVTRDGAAVPMI